MSVVRIENLSFQYSKDTLMIYENIDFGINMSSRYIFVGANGVGKTTLIKKLCSILGVEGATSSPTFSLVNEYLSDSGETIYHFDLYRLNTEMEAYDMGIDEYFYSGNWCFIEWPEKIPHLLPLDHASIVIRQLPNGKRELTLKND